MNRLRGHLPYSTSIALAFTVIYILTWQRGLFDDGIFMIQRLEKGNLTHNHILFLPLAEFIRILLLPLVKLDAESSIRLLASLAGGATVMVAYHIALTITKSGKMAAAAAFLLGCLPGQWFLSTATEIHTLHGVCAALFLYALIQPLTNGEAHLPRWWIIAGAALTPASHTSGIVALLPATCTAFLTRRFRKPLILYTVIGLAVFAAAYFVVMLFYEKIRNYAVQFSQSYINLINDPDKIPLAFVRLCDQWFTHAAPASTLALAGLYLMYRRSPKLAWLFLTWMIAWPILAFPVAVKLHGAYYIPTYCVQVLLAVVAFQRIAVSFRHAAGAAVLAVLPGLVASMAGDLQGGFAWVACSLVLLVLIAAQENPKPRGAILLPLAGLALSCVTVVPLFPQDPTRDAIRDVRAAGGEDAFVFLFDPIPGIQYEWRYYFETRPNNPGRLRGLSLVEVLPEKQAKSMLDRLRKTARREIKAGHPVFVVGDFDLATETERIKSFLVDLDSEFGLTVPPCNNPRIRWCGQKK